MGDRMGYTQTPSAACCARIHRRIYRFSAPPIQHGPPMATDGTPRCVVARCPGLPASMAVPMGLLGKGKRLAKAAKEVATVAVKVARPVAAATGVGKEYETARAQVKVAAEAAKSLTKSLRGTST